MSKTTIMIIRNLLAKATFLSIMFFASSFAPKPTYTTYELWSVDQDMVSASSSHPWNIHSYWSCYRTNLTATHFSSIAFNESIVVWIAKQPFPHNTLSAYVDQIDSDQVGLVKIRLEDGIPTAVMDYIPGDSLQ